MVGASTEGTGGEGSITGGTATETEGGTCERLKGDKIDTGEDEINTGKKKAMPAYVLVMSTEATFRCGCGGGVQMTIFVEREA
ncbi:hypothetical protein FCV25MIE_01759 [Fagus crenata]